MKGVNRDTDYALRALVAMAALRKETGGKPVSAERISREEGLPLLFMRRLLQKMAREKILHSRRGKNGGFSFARSPETITVLEVMEIFQGPVDLTNCFLRKDACLHRGYCRLRARLLDVNSRLRVELGRVSVADII